MSDTGKRLHFAWDVVTCILLLTAGRRQARRVGRAGPAYDRHPFIVFQPINGHQQPPTATSALLTRASHVTRAWHTKAALLCHYPLPLPDSRNPFSHLLRHRPPTRHHHTSLNPNCILPASRDRPRKPPAQPLVVHYQVNLLSWYSRRELVVALS
jgi:hypothetical protein